MIFVYYSYINLKFCAIVQLVSVCLSDLSFAIFSRRCPLPAAEAALSPSHAWGFCTYHSF